MKFIIFGLSILETVFLWWMHKSAGEAKMLTPSVALISHGGRRAMPAVINL